MKINDAIDEGIKRFYLQVSKDSLTIPTRQEIEHNAEIYYPLMCSLLECYGCKYHDSQATVSGRGTATSLSQKLDGVFKKIATVYIYIYYLIKYRVKSNGEKIN